MQEVVLPVPFSAVIGRGLIEARPRSDGDRRKRLFSAVIGCGLIEAGPFCVQSVRYQMFPFPRPLAAASLKAGWKAQSGRRRREPASGGPAAAVAARARWKTASRRQAAPNGTSAMPTPGSPL